MTDIAKVVRDVAELASAFEQPGSITHTTGRSSEVAAMLRRAEAALRDYINQERDRDVRQPGDGGGDAQRSA